MKNILVGINFNEELTEKLIENAKLMAKCNNAKLWLLHVAAPNPDFVGYGPGPQFIRDQRADEIKTESKTLNEIAEKLLADGYDTEALIIQGPTIDIFIEESKKLDIDLIITGYQPRSFFYNILFSSTSEEIIRTANIPVLVVPENKR